MNALVSIPEIALTEIEGEPRARDLDVAERLGYERPRVIRELIERNRSEIEAFGPIAVQHGAYRGKAFLEHWLTEEQALLVATLSNAPNAAQVRHMLIKVFVAWRRGHIQPVGGSFDLDAATRNTIGGMIKRNTGVVVREALAPFQSKLDDALRLIAELEDRIHSPSLCTARDLWIEHALPPVKGGTLWLGNRLLEMGCSPQFGSRSRAGRTWVRQFDAGSARAAMKNGLLLLAERYVSERRGQQKLRLVTGRLA